MCRNSYCTINLPTDMPVNEAIGSAITKAEQIKDFTDMVVRVFIGSVEVRAQADSKPNDLVLGVEYELRKTGFAGALSAPKPVGPYISKAQRRVYTTGLIYSLARKNDLSQPKRYGNASESYQNALNRLAISE